jgi:hypothetical protein
MVARVNKTLHTPQLVVVEVLVLLGQMLLINTAVAMVDQVRTFHLS